jgi:hypothetical protein
MTITVDIEIEDEAWTNAEPDTEALVWRAAQAVLDAHRTSRARASSSCWPTTTASRR